MTNINKARDWLHMALREFDAANGDFNDGRLRELDEILINEVREVEKYVEKHRID